MLKTTSQHKNVQSWFNTVIVGLFFFFFLQAPVGRIFFTGEHTSERFNGYVHGGYLAGEDRGYLIVREISKCLTFC